MGAAETAPRTDVRETRTADTSREGPVELREEELLPRKETVQSGEATLRKDVVSTEKTIDVPVTHEELTVERRPVDHKPADRPIGDSETITVPLREEQVELEKQAVVYEEVELGKRPVTETERVSGTVRREEVRMDREGDVPMASGTTARGFRQWDEVAPTYRQEWQARYGTSGQRWEDVEPYRRYGYEMA